MRAGFIALLLRAGIVVLLWPAPESARATTVIIGVDGELLENVRAFLDEPGCDAVAADVRRYVRDLPNEVRPALEALGY